MTSAMSGKDLIKCFQFTDMDYKGAITQECIALTWQIIGLFTSTTFTVKKGTLQ